MGCSSVTRVGARRRRTRDARWFAGALAALTVGVAGCTNGLDPVDPTVSPPSTATSVTITPVTPDGLLTGPGVSDSTIRLGVLVDAGRDRGLVDGLRLWQRGVNTSGGVCGRTVDLVVNGADGVPSGVADAYQQIGRSVLGLVVVPPLAGAADVNAAVVADQIPALTPTGTSAQLGPRLPVVVGAPVDIQAINAAAYLAEAGRLPRGSRLGVLTDGAPAGADALVGLRWWAARNGVDLQPGTVSELTAAGAGLTAIVAFGDAGTVAQVVANTPAVVVTDVDGYDPATWPAAALARTDDVLVSGPTPAVGADDSAVAAVTAAWKSEDGGEPGPRLLTGFATGTLWSSLLGPACGNLDLTRSAIAAVIAAQDDNESSALFGPLDLATVVANGLPATRQSTLAQARPDAPGGLLPLTELESAPDIDTYRPQ